MQIRLCDRCQQNRVNKTFFVVTGRETDAAGSSDDVGENVDLCGDCAVKLIINIISKERGYDLNKKILNWAKLSPATLFKR